jgi:hypothetical protein
MRVLFCVVTVLLLMAVLAVATNGIERAYKVKARRVTMQRGDRVVAGLGEYFRAKSRYPGQLFELVPKYLSEIEPPMWGDSRWEYELKGAGLAFTLGVGGGESGRPLLYYSSLSDKWE